MRIHAGEAVFAEVQLLEQLSGIEVVRDQTLPRYEIRFPDGSQGMWPYDRHISRVELSEIYQRLSTKFGTLLSAVEDFDRLLDEEFGA